MFASLLRVGSVVVDVNGDRLDVKFLSSTGSVDDSFAIVKDILNVPPKVTVATSASVFAEGSDIAITATASDADGTVQRVDFYADDTFIGSDESAPFAMTWSSVPLGNYALAATAIDNLGATADSE